MQVEELFILDKEKWFLVTTRNMSFWHECLLTKGWYYNMRDFGVDVSLRTLSLTTHGTHTVLYHTNPNYKKFTECLLYVFGTMQRTQALEKKYVQYGDALLKAVDLCTRTHTPKNVKSFLKNYQRYTAALQITGIYGRVATERLREKLAEAGVGNAELDRTIAVITYPQKDTPLFNSRIELLRIGSRFQKSKNTLRLNNDLIQWVENFGNIPVNYCDEPWVYTDAKKQFADIIKTDCTVVLKETLAARTEKLRAQQRMLKHFKDTEIVALAYGLSTASFLNEYRKNIFSTVSLRFRPLFAHIARLGGSTNWRDCFYLTPEEMMDLVQGNKRDMSKIVRSREIIGQTISSRGKFALLSPLETKRLFNFTHKQIGNAKEANTVKEEVVRGLSANAGKVKGKVCVVLSSKDFSKFKKGNILVATMTSVDFVPLMERAAAFVTNEGGVTSHAAVVSRELNKPCIIGTKIATKTFKDGDLVEVDASSGIIRLISR